MTKSHFRLTADSDANPATTISLKPQYQQQGERLSDLWQRSFALTAVSETSNLQKTVSFTFHRDNPEPPPLLQQTHHSPNLDIWRTTAGFYLRCGRSELTIDLDSAADAYSAEGHLDDSFWQAGLLAQRELFLYSFLILLQPLAHYGLHANGLAFNDRGYLISADTGHGKSTLTAALVSLGWHYLSDDALLLRPGPDGIIALAFRRGFSSTRQTAERFPPLLSQWPAAPELNEHKKLLDLEQIFPGQFQASVRPSVLLFPEITGQPTSHLTPLNPTTALVKLAQQSAAILTDTERGRTQLETLKQLTHQTTAHTLHLGLDLLAEPERVGTLLEKL